MTDRFPTQSRRAFLGAAAAGLAAAQLPAAGDSLLDAVNDAEDLELIRRMVQIRSYSRQEGELGKFLVGYMKGMGLETELQEVRSPSDEENAPPRYNAIGILRGTGGGKSLMFNGHIDTNPVGEMWTVDPIGGVVKDGCVYGIGVSNMKASCAAYVGAVRALMKSKTKLKGDIVVAHVVGELSGGDGTRKVVQSGIKTDYFIVGEPTDMALLTVHASGTSMTINTIGVTRHMSKLEESVSAIDTMYQVIQRIRNMKFTDGPRSNPEYASIRRVNVGVMRAALGREFQEWRNSQVPDFAQIHVNFRFGPDLTPQSVFEDVKRELAQLKKEDPRVVTEVELRRSPVEGPRPTYEISKDHPLVKTVASNYEKVFGRPAPVGAVGPARYYGTDAPRLQAAGMTGLVCGVGGKYNTMPDERVELTDYHGAVRIYALSARTLCS